MIIESWITRIRGLEGWRNNQPPIAEPQGAAAAAVAAHVGQSDPHSQYLTPAEGNAAYSALGHSHGVATGASSGFMSAGDKSKLDAIATGATAYTDEMARDAIGAALVAGANVTITVNDAGDTITIATTGGGASLAGDAVVTLPFGQGTDVHSETIAATGVTPAMRVDLRLAPTSGADENEVEDLDPLSITGLAGANSIEVTAVFLTRQSGPVKLQWSAQ